MIGPARKLGLPWKKTIILFSQSHVLQDKKLKTERYKNQPIKSDAVPVKEKNYLSRLQDKNLILKIKTLSTKLKWLQKNAPLHRAFT